MPFVIGVGVLEWLLMIAVASGAIRDVRRGMNTTPHDYAPIVFWLVVISYTLSFVGIVGLIVGGALMLDTEYRGGMALIVVGLCLGLLGCVGIFSWSVIERRVKRRQELRAQLQKARQKFVDVLHARTLTLRDDQSVSPYQE